MEWSCNFHSKDKYQKIGRQLKTVFENMATTKELSTETMEIIVKLI